MRDDCQFTSGDRIGEAFSWRQVLQARHGIRNQEDLSYVDKGNVGVGRGAQALYKYIDLTAF